MRDGLTPEQWAAIEQRIHSIFESDIRAVDEAKSKPCSIRHLKPNEVEALINGLKPASKYHSGQKFLRNLLEAKGVDGLDRFIDKVAIGLERDGQLNPELHFDAFEQRLFNSIVPNLTRRKVLFGAGLVGGATLLPVAGVRFAAHMIEEDEAKNDTHEEAEPDDWKNRVKKSAEFTETMQPGIDAMLGSVAVYYAIREYTEARFEQVAEALTRIIERTHYASEPQYLGR